jgi:hypothetical protein
MTDEEEFDTFEDMPPDMQDLLGNFVHTLIGQLELDTVKQCVTAVKDGDSTPINDRHIEYDGLNISEKLLVTYCRALIQMKNRTIQ